MFYAMAFALAAAALVVVPYAYDASYISYNSALVYSSMALSLLFSFAAVSYMLARGNGFREIARQLGLSGRGLNRRHIVIGLALFLLFFAIEIGMGLFSELTGIQLPTNVGLVFAGMPLYFYIFTFAVAPINEEILFRGFMVPRIGIIASALIFGALHYMSYYSVVEVVAALMFGLASGYAFKKTNSLYPSIIGHVLINLLGVASILYMVL